VLPFEDRYTRQRQLSEVGLSGQQRIASLDVQLAPGPEAEVAALYLRRAGATVEVAPASSNAALLASHAVFPYENQFQWPGARDLAAGCHLALSLIRHQLKPQPEQA
jgi:hypothetical protein